MPAWVILDLRAAHDDRGSLHGTLLLRSVEIELIKTGPWGSVVLKLGQMRRDLLQ